MLGLIGSGCYQRSDGCDRFARISLRSSCSRLANNSSEQPHRLHHELENTWRMTFRVAPSVSITAVLNWANDINRQMLTQITANMNLKKWNHWNKQVTLTVRSPWHLQFKCFHFFRMMQQHHCWPTLKLEADNKFAFQKQETPMTFPVL